MSRLAPILVACLLAAAAWLALRGDDARAPGAVANPEIRLLGELGEPASPGASLAVPPPLGADAERERVVSAPPAAGPSAPDAEERPARSLLVATLFDASGTLLANEPITYEVTSSAAPRANPPRRLEHAATTDEHGHVELPYDARGLAAQAAERACLPGELHRVRRGAFGPAIEVYVGAAVEEPGALQAAFELGPNAPRREPGSLGRLRLAFAPDEPASPPPPSLHADVVLPASPAGDVVDLGSIRLAPLPRLVAGHVVDELGAPIASATVSARRADGAHVGMSPGRTDANGAFALHAATLDDPVARANDGIELLLDAVAAGHVQPQATPARSGDARVVVVLARAGAIHARVLLPDGVEPESVVLRARRADSAPDAPWFQGGVARETFAAEVRTSNGADAAVVARTVSLPVTAPDERGAVRYSIPSIPAGAHVLEARLVGPHPPLAVLAGVEAFAAREGSPTPAAVLDPRLDPLDLRGRVASVDLQPRGADGAVLASYHVYFRATGAADGERWLGRVGSRGPARLTVVGDALDVEISADGHRRLLLTGVRGPQEPTLEPGYELVLEPDSGLRQLVGRGLTGYLLEETRSEKHPNRFDLGVDARGHGTATVCAPGPHPLLLEVRRGSTRVAVACTPEVVDVRDVAGEQRIAVGVSVDELERVLAVLAELAEADDTIRIDLGGF